MVSERFDETKISIDTDDKLSIDITLKESSHINYI